jgi:hypothetical protein
MSADRRRYLRLAAATIALTVGAAAGVAAAGLDGLLGDEVISACRNRSTGVLRVPPAGGTCKGDETPLQWNVRGPVGPAGPTGPAGPASVSALAGTACSTAAGSWGTIRVQTDTTGLVSFVCRAAIYDDAPPQLLLNEIDYDQVGADGGGFVELFNAGRGSADLGGLAFVFVDGADGQEYLRIPLSGVVLAGAFHVVAADPQNGSPDGVVLFDTIDGRVLDALSYEGAIRQASIGGRLYDLVEGATLPATVADSDTAAGSLARIPNGADTDDAAADWQFTSFVSPGNPNYAS